MSILFTGCQHHSHFNIIRYCCRPFDNIINMSNAMDRVGGYPEYSIEAIIQIVYFLEDQIKHLKGKEIIDV